MALQHFGKRAAQYRFAAPLKHTIHAMFGINGVNEEHLTHVKDIKTEQFFGFSPRELYIWMSEQVVKPKFGHDFWSKIAVTSINAMKKPIIVISDCGFIEEAQVLVNAFGKENIAIVHLYREGCDFSKDSRSYITGVDCAKFDIRNDGDVSQLYDEVVKVIGGFVGDHGAE